MKSKCKNFRFKVVNTRKFNLKRKIFAFFLFMIVGIILYLRFVATPLVFSNTRAQIGSFATRSINYAIADIMNQSVSYEDLINIQKNGSGDVSLIEANSVKINALSRATSKLVMSNFLELSKSPIKIALGAFSGISVLTGIGPKLAFKVNPVGEVFCNFSSSFTSAGINQTYHRIYLDVCIKINVVFPLKSITVDSASEVLLCETLIVGKIPEVYLNSNNLTDMLNLIPTRLSS